MNSSSFKISAVFLLGISLGVGLSWTSRVVFNHYGVHESERSVNTLANLTNPYLECPGFSGSDAKLNRAKADIIDFIETKKETDDSLKVSVYARDLNNGPWVGIDEKERYISASLMKVPVMMMLLKQVEQGRLSLEDELVYEPEKLDPMRDINNDALEDVALMVPGESYSIAELMKRMVSYSSNEAFFTLLNIL